MRQWAFGSIWNTFMAKDLIEKQERVCKIIFNAYIKGRQGMIFWQNAKFTFSLFGLLKIEASE